MAMVLRVWPGACRGLAAGRANEGCEVPRWEDAMRGSVWACCLLWFARPAAAHVAAHLAHGAADRSGDQAAVVTGSGCGADHDALSCCQHKRPMGSSRALGRCGHGDGAVLLPPSPPCPSPVPSGALVHSQWQRPTATLLIEAMPTLCPGYTWRWRAGGIQCALSIKPAAAAPPQAAGRGAAQHGHEGASGCPTRLDPIARLAHRLPDPLPLHRAAPAPKRSPACRPAACSVMFLTRSEYDRGVNTFRQGQRPPGLRPADRGSSAAPAASQRWWKP